MENSCAQMVCVLKINNQCGDCKRKVMLILRGIRGVYHISIDGEDGTVKVTGRVNPNTLLSVLERYGKHAEMKYVKFDGEVVEYNPTYNSYYGDQYNNAYDPCCNNSSYPPPQLVAQQQWFVPPYQQPPLPLPPPPPPPPAMYPYPYASPPQPPCGPQGPFWGPQQPPTWPQSHPYGHVPHPNNFAPTPHPNGYRPQPPPPPPPNSFPMEETSCQNRGNPCAIM